ncbi:MAG: transporter substrate-binding domain-containing protein, partial [Caldilinea sp.]
ILVDNVSLRQAQAAGLPLVAVDAPLESIPYVIVMPRRALDLQQQIEASLRSLRTNGKLADLEDRWFSGHVMEELAQ